MFARKPGFRSLFAAAVPIFLSGAALTESAQPGTRLPRPPGVRIETLPRQDGDKPQETFLAVNPRDPRNVVLSFHQAIREGSDHHPGVPVTAHVGWTVDGGKTWAVTKNTTNDRYLRSLDTSVTFDMHGHAFMVYIGLDEVSMTTRHGEFLHRSLDGGRTWSTPVTLTERPGKQEPVLEHFPNIAADTHAASRYAGRLYVIWDRILGDGLSNEEVVLVRSADDGRTWSQPRVIARHTTRSAHSTTVGPDGSLYFVYGFGKDEQHELRIMASRDGGDTFEAPRSIMRARADPHKVADFPRAAGIPAIAADPRGRLFVVWGDDRGGDRDIFVATSDDRGQTWTAPLRVNDDPKSNGKDQILSALSIDPSDGAVYVVFHDRRGDPKNLLSTITLARSTDRGRTFANYAWSTTPLDPRPSALGEYIGLGAVNGRVYGSWPENLPAPPKPPKPEPQDSLYNDLDFPSGPTAMRVGIADFSVAAGGKKQLPR